jgi:hypothetical protein
VDATFKRGKKEDLSSRLVLRTLSASLACRSETLAAFGTLEQSNQKSRSVSTFWFHIPFFLGVRFLVSTFGTFRQHATPPWSYRQRVSRPSRTHVEAKKAYFFGASMRRRPQRLHGLVLVYQCSVSGTSMPLSLSTAPESAEDTI